MTNPSDPVFNSIRAFESQTDDYPIGDVRSNWAPEALARFDRDYERYLPAARDDVLKACEDLIREFKSDAKPEGGFG